MICVCFGWSIVCDREIVLMSMKMSCTWHRFVLGIMGFGISVLGALKREMAVQSVSRCLKLPEIHMCLSGSVCVREV